MVTLADFGVVASPDRTQTDAIQRAVDAAAAKGGTLYVPPGIYRSGTLRLRSNLAIYLAPGAIIKGTGRLDDYPRGRTGHVQIELVDGADVRVFGRGVIDGNGFALRNQFLPDRGKGRAKMLVAHNSRGLVMEDIILRDSAVWCVHTRQSRDMQFRNLKIISVARSETGPDTSHNTDAFDPDNSSNIVIENNFISVDDDAIAVKLTGGERADMSNVVFRNNVIWTMCAALKIGTEVMGGFTVRDVAFENNDVVHAESAMVVQAYRGGYVDGVRWVGNHIERVAAVPNDSPHRKSALIYLNTRSADNFGGIRNALIKDNTFEGFSAADAPSMIRANGPAQRVDGVTIENLVIAGEHRTSAEAARIHIDPSARNVQFR